MKEGIPEEIDGIDVTNVPEEFQQQYVSRVGDVRQTEASVQEASAAVVQARQIRSEHAETADYANEEEASQDPAYQHYTREIGDARGNLGIAQRENNDANEIARDFINESPDIELARGEMERALKKKIEESLG